MTRIPHRDNPGDPWSDDEWDRLYRPRHADPAWPEADVTENPIVGRIYGPRGEVLREYRERPPFGFRSARLDRRTPS